MYTDRQFYMVPEYIYRCKKILKIKILYITSKRWLIINICFINEFDIYQLITNFQFKINLKAAAITIRELSYPSNTNIVIRYFDGIQ